LTETVADLIKRGRPLLKKDVAALRDLAELLNEPSQRAELVDLLQRMPEVMEDQTRTGTYGAWYQYYICGVTAHIRLPLVGKLPIVKTIQDFIESINIKSNAERCQR
jgi:phospholipid/cholesterol/gamma-HCH transport system substrate-binding protein